MTDTSATTISPPLKSPSQGLFSGFQELGLLVVVFVLTALLAGYGWYDARPGRGPSNTFLNWPNLIDGIATPMSYYAIMAVGMTIVVISGGIDISVGSIMALSGLITAWALRKLDPTTSIFVVGPISLLLPLGVGLVCGLINGTLVVGLRMHPFIVTLGTLTIFRGLCNVLDFGGYKTLVVPKEFLERSSFTALLQAQIGGVQAWPMIFMLICVGIGAVFLTLSVWGRQTYAVGGNEEAARFSGIPVGLVKLRVYAISGLCAGFAGLVSLGRFGTMNTTTATGYELTVVAAAVVGGASLSGGRGTALGALLGTLILAEIENAINILRLNQEYKAIIVGMAIIVAVALDRLSEYLRKRRALARH